jgi:hypothetical protein
VFEYVVRPSLMDQGGERSMDMTGEGTCSQELQDQGCGTGDVVKMYCYSGSWRMGCPISIPRYHISQIIGIEHDGLRDPTGSFQEHIINFPFRSKSAVTTASAYWSFASICCPTSPVLMALMRGCQETAGKEETKPPHTRRAWLRT